MPGPKISAAKNLVKIRGVLSQRSSVTKDGSSSALTTTSVAENSRCRICIQIRPLLSSRHSPSPVPSSMPSSIQGHAERGRITAAQH